ncbi:MAG: hypothetical protein JW881_19265 [Spirochaetales bacterium]|nr:hypothetical protein [Spirochaetales bacterium]
MQIIDLFILLLIVSSGVFAYVRLKRQMLRANAENIGAMEKRELIRRIFEK